MPFVIGLTGNIGCGKSTVGRYLAERHGAEYLDADRLVHGLYAPGSAETRAIAERFGRDLLQPDGSLDRRRLGDLVMSDPAALRDLEAILHPGVLRAVEQRIASTPAPVLVVDAIKLIESGLADRCDAVWVVTCRREDQLSRLVETRGLTPEQAALRIDAQPPQAEKVRRATTVLDNSGDLNSLHAQADTAFRSLPLTQSSIPPR